MNKYIIICCLVAVSTLLGLPQVNGTTSPAKNVMQETRPRQPGGLLHEALGFMLTIEGVKVTEGVFVGERTFEVQAINGKKLPKPVGIWIENLELKKDQRYIFRGYENGRMIGTPPAVEELAKEQKREIVPVQAAWQWRTHFVVLAAVEPKGIDIK